MLDDDKTMMPRKPHAAVQSGEETIPGWRVRNKDGRFKVGDLIMNRYKVLAELGQGDMGVVYECFDEIGKITVALKALPPELSHNTLEMEDIKENYQLVSSLVHQNIAVYRNLEQDFATGNCYLIMEYCKGEDLRRWIKRKRKEGTLTLEVISPIIQQVAAALDYAHSEKIIHRDIKPGNIMIDQSGHIKVLDFGLAAQIHTSMTRVSMAYHGTSGTGPYMAPEQWRGRQQDALADQYALAVMTYEMLAGHLPFESPDPAVLQQAVLTQNAEAIPNIPDFAMAAIYRAMSKEPAQRFATCGDFAAALGKIKTTTQPFYKKAKFLKWSAAVLILAIVSGGYCYFSSKANQEQDNQKKIAAEKERKNKIAAEETEKERKDKIAAEAEAQVLILSDDKLTVTRVKNKSIQHCQIPNGITTIGRNAFQDCDKLTSINIPDSVTTIGESAFCFCSNLTSINIPNSVTTIGRNAFQDCDKLTSINIPDSVTTIGRNAFSGCDNLTSITIPNSVTTIADAMLLNCKKLTSIYIPNSVTTIGWIAFSGCDNLTSIYIPDSIESMRYDAFDDIKAVIAAQNNPNFYFDARGVLFNKKTKALLGSPENLTGSYVIPSGVTTIGSEAFGSCRNLTSINIPNSVTTIGDYAFSSCKNLTSITIPNSVTTIGDYAFSSCKNLTSITIPNSVTTIGSRAFSGVGKVTLAPGNQTFYLDNRKVLINKQTKTLIYAPESLSGYYVIPNNVTTIGKGAFCDCDNLTSITIPNSVTTIGERAFLWCDNLTSITIPNSVTTIGSEAFESCRNLTSITIPNSVTTIGKSAFLWCANLTSINIPNSVTTIGEWAFSWCTNLTSITIPNSVTTIGERAFSGCKNLTSITVPAHFSDEEVRKWSIPSNCKIIRR